jgi:hypothetical protein
MDVIPEPFRLSFKVMEIYGYFLPENCSSRRKIFGVFVFSFVHLQFVVASVQQLYFLKDFDDFIVSILYVIFSVNLSLKIINFAWNRQKIIDIVKKFEELEISMDSSEVAKVQADIRKFVKSSFVADSLIGFTLVLTVLVLNKTRAFVIPVLYGGSSDVEYYALYALNYIQVFGIGSSSVAVESIFTICLMMIQSQYEAMKKMIADMKEGEKKQLEKFVNFQVEVRR